MIINFVKQMFLHPLFLSLIIIIIIFYEYFFLGM